MKLDIHTTKQREAIFTTRPRVAEVILSERNLITLLVKLYQPNSNKTLTCDIVYEDGEMNQDLELVIRAEDDHTHYGDRARTTMRNIAGMVHPKTQKFLHRIKKVLRDEVEDV